MPVFHHADFPTWDRFYRANFLNSLSGFKPVSMIGTCDQQGRPNLGLFSNIVHLGADPALAGYVNRPREAAPHTLANIEATGRYTINHVHAGIVESAHQCSAKYAEGVSEFLETGLTPVWEEGISAPFVKESRVRYAMVLEEVLPLRQNGTFFVIGRVEQVWLSEECVRPDGFIDLHAAGSVCSAGLDAYYETRPLGRFAWARPGGAPERTEE